MVPVTVCEYYTLGVDLEGLIATTIMLVVIVVSTIQGSTEIAQQVSQDC